jgi:hypothetical protein
MARWKGIRAVVLAAILALTLAPLPADACVNSWEMTATRGDGQVTLAWGELPAGHSAKVVRSIYGWPSKPTFGDDTNVAGCWVSEPNVVVYRGTDRSVVDTTVVNGRTYWYTLFVRNDATGEYLYEKSEVVATPGPLDTVARPKVGTSYVRRGYRFKVTTAVTRHTCDTKTQWVLEKKVGTSWVYVRSATYTQREGTTSFSAYVTAPTTGPYRVRIRQYGVGEPRVSSSGTGFWSHR